SSPPPAHSSFYTPSLHAALPISGPHLVVTRGKCDGGPVSGPETAPAGIRRTVFRAARGAQRRPKRDAQAIMSPGVALPPQTTRRSEEHTSELQSRENLVCRLLLA